MLVLPRCDGRLRYCVRWQPWLVQAATKSPSSLPCYVDCLLLLFLFLLRRHDGYGFGWVGVRNGGVGVPMVVLRHDQVSLRR